MLTVYGTPLIPHSRHRQDSIKIFNIKRTPGLFRLRQKTAKNQFYNLSGFGIVMSSPVETSGLCLNLLFGRSRISRLRCAPLEMTPGADRSARNDTGGAALCSK